MIDVPFECNGIIEMESIKLKFIDDASPRITSFTKMEESNNVLSKSVKLIKSEFSNFEIEESRGTLLMNGVCKNEEVEMCVFSNITTSKNSKEMDPKLVLVSSCKIKDSDMNYVEDTFYGRIVCGLTFKTEMEFLCSNTSFSHCFRSVNNKIKEKEQNNFLQKLQKNQDQTGETITSQVAITANTTFTSCTFNKVTDNTDWHGAIAYDNTVTDMSLVVDKCKFIECSASFGAGVYVENINHFTLTNSAFTNCKGDIQEEVAMLKVKK